MAIQRRGTKQFKETPTPFPELVSSGWVIRDSGNPFYGGTDKSSKTMSVPMGDDDISFCVRMHELMHAQISPEDLRKFMEEHDLHDQSDVQAAEDYRITQTLKRKAVEPAVRTVFKTKMLTAQQQKVDGLAEGLQRLPPLQAAKIWTQILVSSLELADFAGLWAKAQETMHPTLVEKVGETLNAVWQIGERRKYATDVPSVEFTVEVARLLAESAKALAQMDPKKQGDFNLPGTNVPMDYMATKTSWGDMDIERPRLMSKTRFRIRTPKHRANDEGVKISAMHRMCTDQKIFKTKRTYKGGTVLIDCSGSMSLTHEDVMEMVEQAPAATVAYYAGEDARGAVRIVAQGGKVVDPDNLENEYMNSGNIIDGPALEWLNTMPEPRIWVSDGQVTGRRDCSSGPNIRHVQQLVRKGNIRRIPTAEAAIEAFRDGSLTRSSTRAVPSWSS